jgi:adenosylhomocysteine nucleosidase
MEQQRITGIMGAMPEEIEGVVALLTEAETFSFGQRTYHKGRINGHDVVAVFSRWGKVAAAATASALIHEFHVTELIFTGVAGAIAPGLKVGDIVIGTRFVQHDMDARPLMKEFEIPLLGRTFVESDAERVEIATAAVADLLENNHLHTLIPATELRMFGIVRPAMHRGVIASGDKFFASGDDKQRLISRLPSVLCVEMEGAAVAQVCAEYGLPFTVFRTISDSADEHSHIDFPAFLSRVASRYSAAIIKHLLTDH